MTDGDNSARTSPIVSDERLRNALRRHIDIAINIDHTFTRKSLADDSRVNIHAIDGILSHDAAKRRRLAIEDAFSLAYVLGDAAVNALLATMNWHGSPNGDPNAVSPAQIVAEGLADFSVIAAAAADGRFDHTEIEPCREAADHLIATLLPLSSSGRAA
jgi:hypothetical protein